LSCKSLHRVLKRRGDTFEHLICDISWHESHVRALWFLATGFKQTPQGFLTGPGLISMYWWMHPFLQPHFINSRHTDDALGNVVQNGCISFSLSRFHPHIQGSRESCCLFRHWYHFDAWSTDLKICWTKALFVGGIFLIDRLRGGSRIFYRFGTFPKKSRAKRDTYCLYRAAEGSFRYMNIKFRYMKIVRL